MFFFKSIVCAVGIVCAAIHDVFKAIDEWRCELKLRKHFDFLFFIFTMGVLCYHLALLFSLALNSIFEVNAGKLTVDNVNRS